MWLLKRFPALSLSQYCILCNSDFVLVWSCCKVMGARRHFLKPMKLLITSLLLLPAAFAQTPSVPCIPAPVPAPAVANTPIRAAVAARAELLRSSLPPTLPKSQS